MQPFAESLVAWFRRTLRFSYSRESWEERLAGLLVLVGAGGLWWFGGELSLSVQVVLWGALLFTAALLLRRGWFKLFGPVLFYDLVRTARRHRYFLLRTLYIVFLLILICWMYMAWFDDYRLRRSSLAREMADFAETFFYTFMTIQFVLVGLLTPPYTAGAVADEKDRKTLDFILATDLRNREIILSKLLARLANLALLVLAGLPVLSMTQFLGGVDPDLVVSGYAATGLTMAGVAGVSILTSVYARKARDAIVLTYLVVVAYLCLSGLSLYLLRNPGIANWGLTFGSASFTVQTLVEGFNAGNLIVAWYKLGMGVTMGQRLADLLPGLLRDYAVFHGLLAVACTAWAIARLRLVALKQHEGKAKTKPRDAQLWPRPRVGLRPMMWKEVFAEPGLRLNWFGRIIVGLLVLASFVPVVFIGHWFFAATSRWSGASGIDSWENLALAMNVWVRVVGTLVACLLLLAVAVRAAGTVSGERDRQTFDSLLTTPLDSTDILSAKWLGSILSVRWAWAWLGLIWALGLVTGGLHPIAVPLLLIAWLVYAATLANLGIWFSMVSRTTLRSTIGTLLTALGISFGHWLLLMLCCLPVQFVFRSRALETRNFEGMLWLLTGLTPPSVLGYLLPFHVTDMRRPYEPLDKMILFALVGLTVWAVGAAVLWGVANTRFRVLTGRLPIRPRGVSVPESKKPAAV
jgi:ABC-type transport system involved in multi-copper enzyme maturation permease subunit